MVCFMLVYQVWSDFAVEIILAFFLLFRFLQEKRIYDLKKKNQELEKFKFVLDYKIKELKKQIEPRENDIKAMKEQIQVWTLFSVICSEARSSRE